MGNTITNDDGSTTEENDDGSKTTSWDDGTSRVDYTDGSSMTTYADGRVLNTYADGTRTLNDANGVALDPHTGTPLAANTPATEASAVTAEDIETGGHLILTLTEAAAIVAEAEMVLTFIEPINAVLMPITMAVEVWRALEASVRAYGTMGYCYGLMNGALDMGEPSYPVGPYSLDSEETIADKKVSFAKGTKKAAEQLADGAKGAALRNRILVRTAYLKSDPHATLNELWRVACEDASDEFYAKQFALTWPDTGMTEA